MDKHKKSHSSTTGTYLCPECGRGVKDDRQLKQHLRTVHGLTKDGTKLENIEKVRVFFYKGGPNLCQFLVRLDLSSFLDRN